MSSSSIMDLWKRDTAEAYKRGMRDALAQVIRESQSRIGHDDLTVEQATRPRGRPKKSARSCRDLILSILEGSERGMERYEILNAVEREYADGSVDQSLQKLRQAGLIENENGRYYVIRREEEQQLAS